MFLLAAVILLFQWYAAQNRERIKERNKIYAADSARIKAVQIDEELSNGSGCSDAEKNRRKCSI